MSEDLVPAGGDAGSAASAGGAVSQEIAVIETTLRDRPGDYWARHNEPMRQRYRELLTARESGKPAPAKPSGIDAEIASIEKLLKTDRHQYERSGADARYLELLRQKEGGHDAAIATAETWRTPPTEARRNLDPAVTKHLEQATGGFDANLTQVQNAVRDIAISIGDRELATWFVNSVAGLPTTAQVAANAEILRGLPSGFGTRPASPEQLSAFQTFPHGAAMARHWGAQAARKIGIVTARLDRARAEMSAADRATFDHWFDNVSAREQAAIIWRLAGEKP